MAKTDVWPTIASERKALADDLAGLDDEGWSTPSLCAGWSVRDVIAHMTATAEMSPAKFFPKLIGSGFSLNKLTDKEIAARTKGSPADTFASFKSQIGSTKSPPGPATTWLGETIVHGEDIRRPLGIARDYPTDALVQVADFYKGSNLVIGGKKRIAGLTLKATDTSWTTGSGPEVSGPMLSLVLAIAGRPTALSELSGPGVPTLESRM